MIEAIVQGRFPFGGKDRRPGEVITAEELATTSMAVRDALVSQKLIILRGDGAPGQGTTNADVAELAARIEAMSERLAEVGSKVDALATAFGSGGEQFQEQIDGLRTAVRAIGAPKAPRGVRAKADQET